jgi:branched-chain amino acid transport system ATP-binding protein
MTGGSITEKKSPTTSGVALSLDSISKSYGGLHVLSSVSFDVPVATIFGVAGPNGAGKTTLLNLLTGFGSFSGGRMTIDGVDATGRDARAISALGVARTFQNIRLFRGLTVREQVEAGTYRHRKASLLSSLVSLPADRRDRVETRATAEEMLAFVGLSDSADRLAETMSYGDQRPRHAPLPTPPGRAHSRDERRGLATDRELARPAPLRGHHHRRRRAQHASARR